MLLAALPAVSPAASRRRLLQVLAGATALALPVRHIRAAEPVLLGFDGEFSVERSTSAQAIRAGIEIALTEVNARGGVLGGRPVQLETRDNRTMPARAVQHLREFAAMPSLVAMFCGRYSPAVIETLGPLHELGLPLLVPWASAEGVIDHGHRPSQTFRLALRDAWAMPVLARHAARRGARRLGLVAVNTSWGRSAEKSLLEHLRRGNGGQRLVGVRWFNYTDQAPLLAQQVDELLNLGADALLFVGNFREGAMVVQALAALPAARRRLMLAHSGVMGGDFFAECGSALREVELGVVQSFCFADARGELAQRVRRAAAERLPEQLPRLPSAAGLAQAYDLTHITLRALERAGRADRRLLRDALEQPVPWQGLVRRYAMPFSPQRHEGLTEADHRVLRFDALGQLRGGPA